MRTQRNDSGNATAEFVMVSALVVMLFLGVLQVAFAMYAKNLMQDAASQGARYGALLDKQPEDGAMRSRELLYSALPESYPAEISSSLTDWGGVQAVQVQITSPVPLLGPFGLGVTWEVTGHAVLQG